MVKKEDFIMKKNAIKVVAIALLAILVVALVMTSVYAAEEKDKISYGTFTEKNVTKGASDNSGAAASVLRCGMIHNIRLIFPEDLSYPVSIPHR